MRALSLAPGAAFFTDGHEVFDFGDAIFQRETGDQDIGGRPVELALTHFFGDGIDLEAAAFFVVEDRAEDAGGIEVGRAVPVDGAVATDERGRAHVADDAIVGDGQVGHKDSGALAYLRRKNRLLRLGKRPQ